eukprot:1499859-Rhodomonas_salina.2
MHGVFEEEEKVRKEEKGEGRKRVGNTGAKRQARKGPEGGGGGDQGAGGNRRRGEGGGNTGEDEAVARYGSLIFADDQDVTEQFVGQKAPVQQEEEGGRRGKS